MMGVLALLALGIMLAGSRESEPTEQEGSPTGARVSLPIVGKVRDRIGAPRDHGPHQGFDIYATGDGTVYAYGPGVVDAVIDGRRSNFDSRRRAGLFVEVKAQDGNLHRYLHLGEVSVAEGQPVEKGQRIGRIERDHLHFEIRKGHKRYGEPLAPVLT